MQISEKNINGKMRRIVIFNDNRSPNLYYVIDELRKKCIYFDYLVVYYTHNNVRSRQNFTVYFNDLSKLDNKYKPQWDYFSSETLIYNYEKHPDFLINQRYNKLKRLINE